MSLLTALSHQLTWEEFLTYRLQKGRFNWHEFDVADTFVSEKLYLPVVERMLRGEGLSFPTKHLVNKMGSGKKRVVYSFEDCEMNVLKCLSYLLYRFDSTLSPNCYSFRRGLTAHDAIHDILRATNGRHMWAYKVDIHNYFNSISIPLLLPILRELLAEDPTLYSFFEQILTEECAIFKGEIVRESHGVMAGTPISPFLANIYLKEVDQHFAENGVIYARYSDDIILFAPDEPTLMQHISTLSAFLQKYRLEVNPEKEQIYRPDEPFESTRNKPRKGADLSPRRAIRIPWLQVFWQRNRHFRSHQAQDEGQDSPQDASPLALAHPEGHPCRCRDEGPDPLFQPQVLRKGRHSVPHLVALVLSYDHPHRWPQGNRPLPPGQPPFPRHRQTQQDQLSCELFPSERTRLP